MTKQELRLTLLRLIWPDGPQRHVADPDVAMKKVERLEQWIARAGDNSQEPPKRRGRPPKVRRFDGPAGADNPTP